MSNLLFLVARCGRRRAGHRSCSGLRIPCAHARSDSGVEGFSRQMKRRRARRPATAGPYPGPRRPQEAWPWRGPRHRPGHRQHAGLRPRRGHRPERALGHRPQQPDPGRPGHGPRGLADDRPDARATSSPCAPCGPGAITDFEVTQRMIRLVLERVGVSPLQPAPGRDLRAVGHHRGGAPGGHRGGPPGRRGRGPAHRAAHGRRHRRRAAHQRADGQHGRRHRRRHLGDRHPLAGRRRGPQGGAGGLLRLRRRHPDLHPQGVRDRHRRADRREDQDRHRLGATPRPRSSGRGAGPRADVRPAQDRDPRARGDPGRPRGAGQRHHRLGGGLPRRGAARAGPGPDRQRHPPGRRRRDAPGPRPSA